MAAAAATWADPDTPPVIIDAAALGAIAVTRGACVSFDLDGTLWPPAGPALAKASLALNDWLLKEHPAIAAHHGGDVGLDTLMGAVAKRRPDISHCYTALRSETLRQAAIATRAAGADAADPEAVASAGIRVFRRARSAVTPYPGVVEMLAALRDGGLRVVTLTNGNADVEATPLAGLVDASVSPALVGSAKPDRAMFEAAAKAGRAMAGSTLHVGDDPEADVRSGAATEPWHCSGLLPFRCAHCLCMLRCECARLLARRWCRSTRRYGEQEGRGCGPS